MGSRTRIVVYAENDPTEAVAAAFDRIAQLESVLSDYDTGSETMRLTAAPAGEWRAVSPDLLDVLVRSRTLWAASEGAFDPTVGPLTRLWREARRSGRIPSEAELAVTRRAVGFEHIEIDRRASRVRLARDGMGLDFGGIGKGYAAGEALAVLQRAGYASSLVDLGGDLAIGTPPPGERGWRIAIATGLGTERVEHLSHVGIATSGDLERFLEVDGVRYSHILDPRTGLGLTRRVAVTAISPQPWFADAAASAASVAPPLVAELEAMVPGTRIVVIEAVSEPR